jgi:hypothetical protein
MKYTTFFFFIFFICSTYSCRRQSIEEKTNVQADRIFNEISKGNASELFPEEHFKDRKQLLFLLSQLKNKCDIKNRSGNFVDNYVQIKNGIQFINCIFEYHLQCGDIRFVLTFEANASKIELWGFKLETIQEDNAMITHPERRLWKKN